MRAPRIAYKQPRPATAIEHGATGRELLVCEARDHGRILTVCHESYGSQRVETLTRSEDGWWTCVRRPCLVCGEPTADRVLHYDPDGGWQPVHHRSCGSETP